MFYIYMLITLVSGEGGTGSKPRLYFTAVWGGFGTHKFLMWEVKGRGWAHRGSLSWHSEKNCSTTNYLMYECW